MEIRIEGSPPSGDTLETALEEFMNRVKLRNEQAATELIERLKEQIRRDANG